MNKYIFQPILGVVLLAFLAVCQLTAETDGVSPENNAGNHRLYAFWGSLRTPYAQFVSGLDYTCLRFSPEVPIGVEARMESFGSFYIISTSSMDFNLCALWRIPGSSKDVTWSLGVGYLLEARFKYDSRSAATTTYAPFVRFAFDGTVPLGGPNDPSFGFRVPLDCAFYKTGFAASLLPELRLDWQVIFIVLEAKARLLVAPGNAQTAALAEFRWDSYIGIGLRL